MSARSKAAPLAVRLGLAHVGVARFSEGWAAMMWTHAAGPQPISGMVDYETAVDRARAYAAIDPIGRVLDLPDGLGEVEGRGLVHLDRRDDGRLEVMHESASGNSFATLRFYQGPERKRALLFALDVLAQYQNPRGASRLGRVAP